MDDGRTGLGFDGPLKAPYQYFGGKSRVAHQIWAALGDVDNYLEPFAGSLATLLARPAHQLRRRRTETVNDLDAFIANLWRAMAADPNGLADLVDWPVNEADLHARHLWLVNRVEFRERMKTDPEYYDLKVAGWWLWGISLWIGTGWCAAEPGAAPSQSLPAIGGTGMGVHRKLPAIGGTGMGVHRKLPATANTGCGVHRKTNGSIGEYFEALAARLRYVRVACGDWSRILGPSTMKAEGGAKAITGVLLDPPYDQTDGEISQSYAAETSCAKDVMAWAIEHGDDPTFRIVLCGYEGHYQMPDSWRVVPWKARVGYGGQRRDGKNENSGRERLWLSPHCQGVPVQQGLFDRVDPEVDEDEPDLEEAVG